MRVFLVYLGCVFGILVVITLTVMFVHNGHASNLLTGSVLLNPKDGVKETQLCRLGDTNQTFNCSSIFDSTFYITTYQLNISPNGAIKHYQEVGMRRGYRFHGGNKIFKIILSTKNEWPLLEFWVLYHGQLVGYQNIYIISSDTDLNCIHFLSSASKSLGFNYFVTHPSFESIEFHVNDLASQLRYTADFITKLDTDEYLSFYEDSFDDLLSKDRFQDHLNNLEYDGGSYNISYIMQNLPNETACLFNDHPILKSNKFWFSRSAARKVILPAPSFGFMDIGNHHSQTLYPYNITQDKSTKLVIIDFHFQCYERAISNNRKGIINRGFISGNEPIQLQIQKLRPCGDAFPQSCLCASCHKVHGYLNHLLDPRASREKYYLHFTKHPSIKSDAFKKYVTQTRMNLSSDAFFFF